MNKRYYTFTARDKYQLSQFFHLQLTIIVKTSVYDVCVLFYLRPMSKHLRWEQEKPRKIRGRIKTSPIKTCTQIPLSISYFIEKPLSLSSIGTTYLLLEN